MAYLAIGVAITFDQPVIPFRIVGGWIYSYGNFKKHDGKGRLSAKNKQYPPVYYKHIKVINNI